MVTSPRTSLIVRGILALAVAGHRLTWASAMVLALVLSFAIDAVIAVGLKPPAFSSAKARLVFGHLLLAPAGLAARPGTLPAGGTASSSAVRPPRCAKGAVELFPLPDGIRARRFSIITPC